MPTDPMQAMSFSCSRQKDEFPLIFHVNEKSGLRRVQEPITMGIPFPKGIVSDAGLLVLYQEEHLEVIPLQVSVTTRWVDHSIQWALLDFLANVEAYGATSYRLAYQETFTAPSQNSSLSFTKNSDYYVVETGAASFFLNPTIFTPFSQVIVEGENVLDEASTYFMLTDGNGEKVYPEISHMAVETNGPVRLTLKFDGVFPDMNSTGARFMARMMFYAGSSTVMLQFTLHNPQPARHTGGCWDLGDEGSMFFKDLSWHVALRDSRKITSGWNVDAQEPMHFEEHSSIEIYQDSSGGANWNSRNHINRFGQIKQKFSGYRVVRDGVLVREGKRALPSIFIKEKNIALAGAIQNFWQNFPKSLEVDSGKICLRFFPQQFDDVYELQAGEQKTHICGVAFTQSCNPETAVNWIHDPLRSSISPEWYAQSMAIRCFTPRSEDKNVGYSKFIDTAIEEPNSWFSRREIIDEYGWRHFGEIYADHEAVKSSEGSPLVSHYNNQYDVVFGLLIEYLRTGEGAWWSLMQDLARHVVDIDIYHTQDDRSAYNGGLFWHSGHYTDAATATHRTYSRINRGKECSDSSFGGGPSSEQNYTSGLLHYYFLTGDPIAADMVKGLADWVINMDDPHSTMFGKFDRRHTGLASSSVDRAFHGPGRGAGNSVNALIDGYVLTKERRYLQKSEELIKRCIHPLDDISRLHLEDIERRWSYTVFLSVLGKYLDLKITEDELDEGYAYARGALLHYAAWMVENEVPYKQILHRVEIPTETWSAQDMRKSQVLNITAKYAEYPFRQLCQKKARFFFDTCLTDLHTFKTWAFVRPIVLLLTNGYVQAYYDRHPDESAPLPSQTYDFGFPKKFRPQGDELYRLRELLAKMRFSMEKCVSSFRNIVGKEKGISN